LVDFTDYLKVFAEYYCAFYFALQLVKSVCCMPALYTAHMLCLYIDFYDY